MNTAPLIFFVFFCSLMTSRCAPAITQEELVRRTQELFDSVVPGDKTPWKKYYADDCLFHDEKGRGLDQAKLVEDIAPLPTGYSGSIKVKNPESRVTADTAVLTYDCDETETIFGQELRARYHQTDTWLLRDAEWRIIASQVMRYYEDPAVGKMDAAKFPGFVGNYALGPERKTVITAENGQLFMERSGGKKTQLFPEAADIFFRKEVEGRILFEANGQGKIDSMIDRRNNEDVVWRKVD